MIRAHFPVKHRYVTFDHLCDDDVFCFSLLSWNRLCPTDCGYDAFDEICLFMNPPHRYRLPFPRPFCFSFDRDYGSSRDSLIDDGVHVFLSHRVLPCACFSYLTSAKQYCLQETP
mmetsp:Transcript_93637/g.261995  ORF Transcript_93637/g.261995 Transcript_93637/m.261995 type:complete len:115 (+) Transcript_93637:199-543(+)